MQQRIRAAMHADQADLLRGIVEADVRSFIPNLKPSGSNTFRRYLGNEFDQGDGQADDADGHQLLSGPGSSPRPQSPVPPALPKWTLCILSDLMWSHLTSVSSDRITAVAPGGSPRRRRGSPADSRLVS